MPPDDLLSKGAAGFGTLGAISVVLNTPIHWTGSSWIWDSGGAINMVLRKLTPMDIFGKDGLEGLNPIP